MTVTAESSDQYSHGPVPGNVTMAGWRVALIVASFSIGQPDFLNGAHNALALGLPGAVAAAFLGALALCIGCCFTAVVSVRTRLSTYLLVQRSFGRYGAVVINIVIALIHYGAFGMNASFVGEALGEAALVNGVSPHFALFVILGSLVSVTATIIGIRALDRLSLIVVPVLAAIFIAVAVIAVQRHGLVVTPSAHPPVPMRFGIAVTTIIGAYMLAVATMPDLSRYIRTERGAVVSMALSFPIATPLMMTTAALPALATGETSVAKLIVALGLGTPLLFVLALPMLTVNAANLYSSGLALSTTFPKIRRWMFTVLGAVIGTGFALAGILDYFIPFLVFLGLIIPPIAAIYVIDSFTLFRGVDPAESIRTLPPIRWEALGVWIGSLAVIQIVPTERFTLTTVPALDATIIAAVGYLLVLKLKARRGASATMAAADA
ncbi:cytosine permease [Sphingomonas sp. HITSZ_GF]|uniref:cytosine permease n=1 Tax=Sphingomonas sp. HITSZ_GF TaxID=3037247 RepID=UPI00240D156D|nr:cytosine permease [Sphingomonas sp. HITSZ_GF]MDG2534175.1 cytosine permease [Sphingomonas sp. HITSZ_GF]